MAPVFLRAPGNLVSRVTVSLVCHGHVFVARSPRLTATTPYTPDMKSLVTIGAGGHALVIADAAQLDGWSIAGCLDDDDDAPLDAPRLGGLTDIDAIGDCQWIIAVGNVEARRAIIHLLDGRPGAATVRHPSAFVSSTAAIGPGAFLAPSAVVHTRADVKPHAILNSACVVEHECRIGENAHIAPGAVLGGRVSIGPDTLVGLGARVLPNLTIGRGCTIGAGAVVTRSISDGDTAAGVPASVR